MGVGQSVANRLGPEGERILREAGEAFATSDAARLRDLLARYPPLKQAIDEPLGPFDSPAITHVTTREMLDVLLEAGADINARSRWWAGSFGILDLIPRELADYAIERGATVDVNAAARLGLIDRVRDLLAQDAALVHARGGDGQTPLHVAANVDVATLLLDAGADIDARDVDHESTPAQYAIRERQDVAQYLVTRGCHTDLLMAAALGHVGLALSHLDRDPGVVRMQVTDEWFPKQNPKAGGTIYQWTLGFYLSAHQVAKAFERTELLQLLFDRSPAILRLLEACVIGDADLARRFRSALPEGPLALSDSDRRRVADAARNNDAAAVQLLLESGWPVDARGQHQATPLHWAAFHGNGDMIRSVLGFDPPLEAVDADFHATPLGWAIHGSEHGWYAQSGDYGTAVERLLRAGAKRPDTVRGSAAVRAALAHTV